MAKSIFEGVLAFPVTPLDAAAEHLDLRSYERLLNHMIKGGIDTVIPLGSTGEFAYLNLDERKEFAEATISLVDRRIPTVIGVSALTTREAIHLAEHAESINADGVMISIPTYYALNADEVAEHVDAIASSVRIPAMLYNNPFTSQVDLGVDAVKKLIHIKNLASIKEATMDVNRISSLKLNFGERFEILGGGFDPYAFSAFCLGVKGWTTGMANVVPAHCAALYQAVVRDSDLVKGRELHEQLLPLANLLVEFGLAKALKGALGLMGLGVGPARPPLGHLPKEHEERLQAALTGLGVL